MKLYRCNEAEESFLGQGNGIENREMGRMKKVTYVKLAIDIVMAVVFVLLFNKQVLGGLTFHEIAGLAIAVIFLTHVLLNAQWVKKVTLKLFDRKLPGKTRFGYLLNLLLLLTMTFNMVSGVIISRVVFPNINVGNETWFKVTHISVSFLTFVLVAVHVGLHWQWVIQVWKKIFKVKSTKLPLGIIAKAAAILMLAFGGYEMYATGFVSKLSGVSFVFGGSSMQQMPIRGEGRPMMMQEGGQAEQSALAEGQTEGSEPTASMQSGFPQNGERPTRPEGGMGMKGDMREGGQSASVLGVLTTYFGIMSVFIVIVYYLEKFIMRKKRKIQLAEGM